MLAATLDPRIFAAPREGGATAAQFRAFVTSLTNWRKLADDPNIRVCVSDQAAACLFEDGCYPLPASMIAAMKTANVFEYDLNTIKLVVERLLKMTPSFEEHCRFKDLMHSALAAQPDVLLPESTPSLSGDAGRCLLILTILSRYCGNSIGAHRFATPRLTGNARIQVDARVEIVEHSRTDLHDFPALPAAIQGEVHGCQDFDAFLLGIDAAHLFLAADTDERSRFALRAALYQSRRERGLSPDWFEIPTIFLHPDFRPRATQCCGADVNLTRLVLQACVEVVDRFNLQRGHPIRVSQGGGSTQLVIKGHGAQRHNISAEYHLHYWERRDNRMELAWISHPHDDMWIPQPQ